MTVSDISRFFEGRKLPGRIMVYRKHNVIMFKVRRENLEEVRRVFDALKPSFMRFLYKPLNFWDHFLIRKRRIRMELR